MADCDTVKMRLTFWRDGKQPGDVIEVRADEVHRWEGFAKKVEDTSKTESSKAQTDSNPTTGSQQQKAAGK